jgi:hypothetical protein
LMEKLITVEGAVAKLEKLKSIAEGFTTDY